VPSTAGATILPGRGRPTGCLGGSICRCGARHIETYNYTDINSHIAARNAAKNCRSNDRSSFASSAQNKAGLRLRSRFKVQVEIQEKTHVPTQATTQLKARPSSLRDEQRAVLRETQVRTRADVHREVNRGIRPMLRQVVAAATGGIVPARVIRAPGMGADLRVRVSITEVDCTNCWPKASASPRGGVRRKPEAKLRSEEHESHTRPGQPGELASNSEARCNQGLAR